MMAFPKTKQTKKGGVWYSENQLQEQANDYLAVKGVFYFRIPDKFWAWVNRQYDKHAIWIRRTFGGWPDNTCFEPIHDKYCLCLGLELKGARGQLHGKQCLMSNSMRWTIARSPEQTIEAVDSFVTDSQMLREVFQKVSIDTVYKTFCGGDDDKTEDGRKTKTESSVSALC